MDRGGAAARRSGAFRSLASRDYRVWAAGAVVSNVGTMMQRTAQDWLVLTQLTHRDAAAIGIVMSLQFGPLVLLLPLTGYAADRFDRRRVLIATQASLGTLALALGVLTVTGLVRLWMVDAFALALGCVTAFDQPTRQTFVAALVPEEDLASAVALNSTSFNAGRLIGPAVAGLVIAAVGTGWAFLINAASYVCVLASLAALRARPSAAIARRGVVRGIVEGFRYLAGRPDLLCILVMMFLIGTFGLNSAIFVSTMSVSVFHGGAQQYGLLASAMAAGSITGALLAARRARPGLPVVAVAAGVFGCAYVLASLAPNVWLFGAVLVVVGVASQTVTTTANTTVQLSTGPQMRGRVMAVFFAIALGGTPIGAPFAGWVANRFGPREALLVGAAAGLVAAAVAAGYLVRMRRRDGAETAGASRD